MIIIRIIIASITKRAQVPFRRWLPAAIAAPTPVRALVHSSTLVTAGVFLLVRFYPFLSSLSSFNSSILLIACVTIIMSGISALVECDIKKIVALSTLSQLGVMIAAIGLGHPLLAFFHLVAHALFKALLFICVGNLIHLHFHSQDLRLIGNLVSELPLTSSCMNISNIALCGLPFMSGFYSKDLIIELSLYEANNFIIIFLFLLSTFFTAAYRVRLVCRGILSIKLGSNIQYVEDGSIDILLPIVFLGLGGVVGGCCLNWVLIRPYRDPRLRGAFKLLAFILTILGGLISYFGGEFLTSVFYNNVFVHDINSSMWFISNLSTQIFLDVSFKSSFNNLYYIDQG